MTETDSLAGTNTDDLSGETTGGRPEFAAPRDLTTFHDLHEHEPGLFAVVVLTLSVGLATHALVRYLPAYLRAIGAGPVATGVVWSGWSLARIVSPYLGSALAGLRADVAATHRWPADALSGLRERYAETTRQIDDRDGLPSRYVVGGFALVAALGYLLWVAALQLRPVTPLWWAVGPWVWTLAGVMCLATWHSHSPGITSRTIECRIPTGRVAEQLAAVQTFRRVGVLVGLLVLAGVFIGVAAVRPAFQLASAGAASLAVTAAVGWVVLDPGDVQTTNRVPPSLDWGQVDLRRFGSDERALVLSDALVRFGRGLYYPFLVLAVVDFGVSATVLGAGFGPMAVFTGLFAVETVAALFASMPVVRLGNRVGLEPVVGGGFLVLALFPLALAAAPPNALVATVLFGGFGVGVATRPARRELLVRVARGNDDRTPKSLRLAGQATTVVSALVGGALYAISPTLAFGLATAVGLLGCWEFLRHVHRTRLTRDDRREG